MPCFDYEEVECVRCKTKTQDGYSIINDEVVCDECMTEEERNETVHTTGLEPST